MAELSACVGEPGGQAAFGYRVLHTDGRWRHVETVITNLLDSEVGGIVLNLHDVTEWVEADRVRQAAETRFEIAFEQAAFGAVISDLEGYPTRVNPAVCSLLGRPEDELVGRRWTEYAHPEEIPLGQAVLTRVDEGSDRYEDERRYLRPDGSVVWASVHVTLVRDDSGAPQYFFAQVQDITERKQMENELVHQALHDSLTGLPNRALLTDRLVQGLASSRRDGTQLAVMFLDVDHFKVVNDSLGHTCGDDLLRCPAGQIAAAIRPGDTVARFGGDEFVVVCGDVTVPDAEEIATRILLALSRPSHRGRSGDHHHRQPRHRRRRRQRHAREPPARRRHRHVSRQGPWPRSHRDVHRPAALERRATFHHRVGAPRCARAWRIHPLLPAHRRPLVWQGRECRGPAPVGPPDPRPRQAR